MKKILLLVSSLLFTLVSSGQTAYDLLLKAKALNEGGKHTEAIKLLSGAVNNLNDYRLFLELAESKILTGDYEGAIQDLSNSNRIMPFSGEYGLARIFAIRKDASVSVTHLVNVMNSDFKRSEKQIMLDPAFSQIENRSEWRQFWKKEWYTDIERGISEMEYYLSAGKEYEALAIQADLEKVYPGKNELVFSSALIDYSSGRPQEAIKKLNKLIAQDPGNGKYLELLAETQTALSNYAGASATLTRLISLEIPVAGFYLQRAECYRRTGELKKSMDDIEKYLQISPEDKTGLSMAGRVKAASGDNLKALEYFSENIRLHPGDAECYKERADAYFISKSWNWSINDYSMSLDLNPGNADVWLNKGIALVNTGKTDDGCHDFREALTMGNKRAVNYLSRYCIK